MSRLTDTFEGQLFHRQQASAGSYGPRAHRLPVQPVGLLAIAVRPFRPRASWRTRIRLSSRSILMDLQYGIGGSHRAYPLLAENPTYLSPFAM
jgi:hypothetical protein